MKNIISLLCALLLFVITQAFRCEKGYVTNCDTLKSDTVLLNTSIINPALEYHLYDTVWMTSIISDNFSPLSGSPVSFTKSIDQLTFNIMPYSINTSGPLPVLQFANIEFNPVVREGSLQPVGYSGYNYLFRRVAPNNSLQAGLVAGRTGLFLVEVNHGIYYNGPFNINNGNDYCISYNGASNIPAAQQNRSYWSTLGVTSISLAPNYGPKTVSINNRNYFIIKVIP